MPGPAVHPGFEAAAVKARQRTRDVVREERKMPRRDKQLGDTPDVVFRSHPVKFVEAREIHRDGIGAESALAAQVVIVLEVAEGQLARCAVDRSAKAEAGKVRFGDATPEAVIA